MNYTVTPHVAETMARKRIGMLPNFDAVFADARYASVIGKNVHTGRDTDATSSEVFLSTEAFQRLPGSFRHTSTGKPNTVRHTGTLYCTPVHPDLQPPYGATAMEHLRSIKVIHWPDHGVYRVCYSVNLGNGFYYDQWLGFIPDTEAFQVQE